jgi:hypothetical protein
MVSTVSRQSGNQRATAEARSGQAKLHSRRLAVLLAAPLVLAAGLLLTLLLVSQPAAMFIPGLPFSGAVNLVGAPAPDQLLSLLAGPRTNATIAVLPPFEPTCFVIHELREQVRGAFHVFATRPTWLSRVAVGLSRRLLAMVAKLSVWQPKSSSRAAHIRCSVHAGEWPGQAGELQAAPAAGITLGPGSRATARASAVLTVRPLTTRLSPFPD